MKKIILILLSLFLYACQPKQKKLTYNFKIVSEFTSEWILVKPLDKHRDSSFLYWPNGRIKEKGIYYDHYKKGWWYYYDSLGNLIKKSYEKFNHKDKYFEQNKTGSKNGQIDYQKSNFLHIDIKDTLILGKKNKAKIQLISANKNRELRSVCIKMSPNKNFIYNFKDSLCLFNSKGEFNFEIIPRNTGKDTIKGTVSEELLDSTIFQENKNIILNYSLFEYPIQKPVIVVDSL